MLMNFFSNILVPLYLCGIPLILGSSSNNETYGPQTAPAAEGSVLGNAAVDANKLASFLTHFKMSSSPVQKSRGGERHMRILYDDLFADYQREIRPVLNDSEPLTVAVQFWLKQILKVDERDQTLNVYLWLELYWVDELLKWNPEHYGGLDRIHVPASKIWRPDLLVYNNANMNVEDNEMETNAIIKSNGEVTLFRAMITDIACSLSLSLFPFDQQVCYLTFASWSMDGSKLLLYPMNNSTNLELYVRNTEWELTDFTVKMYEKVYDCCPHPFPDITYFIALKRSPSYYIFSLIIPSAFITVVTIVGFFTPHSTTGENTEKVSTAVTALLSMTIIMMMVSDEVPATSEHIPLIGKYYIGLIFIIFVAAFTTTLTLAFQMRGNAGARMSPQMKYFLFERIAKSFLGYWIFTVQITNKRSSRRFRIRAPSTDVTQLHSWSSSAKKTHCRDQTNHKDICHRAAKGKNSHMKLPPNSDHCNNNNSTYFFPNNNSCQQNSTNSHAPANPSTKMRNGWRSRLLGNHTKNALQVEQYALNNNVIENHVTSLNNLQQNTDTPDERKRARIVRMDELMGDNYRNNEDQTHWIEEPNPCGQGAGNCSAANCVIAQLNICTRTIEESLAQAHEQKYIEFEWEQGTRIIERLIMIFYIILTMIFAFVMLGDTGDDIRLTEEVMDKIKR